jgi:hypothetical protein
MNRWNPLTPLTLALAVVLAGVVLMPFAGLVLGYLLVLIGLSGTLFVLYIVCMRLIRRRQSLHGWRLWGAHMIVAIGYVNDVLVNALMSVFPFWDWPLELTLTDRVNRYRSDPACTPRRRRLANWFCKLLTRYDPKHCVAEVPLRKP